MRAQPGLCRLLLPYLMLGCSSARPRRGSPRPRWLVSGMPTTVHALQEVLRHQGVWEEAGRVGSSAVRPDGSVRDTEAAQQGPGDRLIPQGSQSLGRRSPVRPRSGVAHQLPGDARIAPGEPLMRPHVLLCRLSHSARLRPGPWPACWSCRGEGSCEGARQRLLGVPAWPAPLGQHCPLLPMARREHSQ